MKKGFTLVEIIISVVVIAIIAYAGIAVYSTSAVKDVAVDVFTVAQSLAEGKLEETMAKDFADINSVSSTAFSGDLSNFNYTIIVNYVSPEALDVPIVSATDYKKIGVSVSHFQLTRPTTLECLRANY